MIIKHLSISFIAIVALAVCSCSLPTMKNIEWIHWPKMYNPVSETLHGRVVVDEFRGLENFDDPVVQEWINWQNRISRKFLDGLPQRDYLRKRLTELRRYDDESTPDQVLVGDRIFYSVIKKDWERWAYYTKENENAGPELLLDPNQWGLKQLGAVYPSRDGKYLAYSVEEAGKENPVIKIMVVGTKEILRDSLAGWRQAGISWLPDNSGFYYTANPLKRTVPAGEENYWDAVYFHKLGTMASEDAKLFYHDKVKEYFHSAEVSEDGKYILFYRSQFYKNEVYLQKLGSDQPMIPVITFMDAEYSINVIDDKIVITTNWDAPKRRVMITDIDKPDRSSWTEIIPETEDNLEYINTIAGQLYAVYMHNAHTVIKIFTLEGKYVRDLPLPTFGTAAVWGYWSKSDIWVNFTSYTYPGTVFKYDFSRDTLVLFHRPPIDIDLSDYTVEQVWYQSKDGTLIPMFLVYRKSLKLNSNNGVYLTGYGGFNIPKNPSFSSGYAVWLESGGMIAIPGLRGGSEFGEEWHKAGMLNKKQNVFDDFIYAAKWLIGNKYTSTEKLGIAGGSNGGLLTGAALVQAPELFRAVYVGVPLLDMLRYHKFSYANIWAEEYGSADDSAQFECILKYSPYHNVTSNTIYPAVLFEASDNDPRCHPMHAMKTAAKMQAAQAGKEPILLLVRKHAGHSGGITLSESIDEQVDEWSFMMEELGLKAPNKK
ncbi:MAG TPA: prolyl oligopeptidase family serine peptidase [bacterium]